jgi:hypothetical protein
MRFNMVGAMTIAKIGLAAIVLAAMTMPGFAGDLNEVFAKCASKYGRSTKDATVTLECTAAAGKVSDCKVIEAPSPTDGFDKAALCVADSLPIGNKTGTIKFPIKFTGSHY